MLYGKQGLGGIIYFADNCTVKRNGIHQQTGADGIHKPHLTEARLPRSLKYW